MKTKKQRINEHYSIDIDNLLERIETTLTSCSSDEYTDKLLMIVRYNELVVIKNALKKAYKKRGK